MMMWIEDLIDKRAYNLIRYKAGKPIEEIKREIFANKEVKILKLASNENLSGVDKYIIKKLRDELQYVYYYPDDSMYYLLKSLSKFYGIDEERIVVGNGAVELIRYIYAVLIKEGDIIFSPHPTFAIYYIDSNLFGARHITYDLKPKEYQIRSVDILNGLQRIIKEGERIKLVVICSPNNPTGSIITKDDLMEVLEYCNKNHILVVLDEAYFEFADNPNYHNGIRLIDEFENLIVLRTFSKVFSLAGLRIGIAFSNPYIIKALNNIRLPFNVNMLAQKAAIYSLEIYDKLLSKIKRIIRNKYYVYKRLDEIKVDYIPTYANFISIKVDDHMRVYEGLLREGVIVRPASDMNMGSYIRVTISPRREDIDLFLEKFVKVCARSSTG